MSCSLWPACFKQRVHYLVRDDQGVMSSGWGPECSDLTIVWNHLQKNLCLIPETNPSGSLDKWLVMRDDELEKNKQVNL